MRKHAALIALASATVVSAPAFARPPADALPLSEIISALEAEEGFGYISDIDWDDDDGHWEVEYYTTEGREVEVDIDPLSGERR